MEQWTNSKILLVTVVVLWAGCGGRSMPGGSGTPDDGTFCSGAAKLSINGKAFSLSSVKASVLAMGCCDGAILHFAGTAPEGQGAEVAVAIKVSGPVTSAADLDLARLPSDVEVALTYQPCSPPVCSLLYQMNTFKDSFSGRASISAPRSGPASTSLCLTGQSAGKNPNFNSIQLYSGGPVEIQ